jgi:hypothetical protein
MHSQLALHTELDESHANKSINVFQGHHFTLDNKHAPFPIALPHNVKNPKWSGLTALAQLG